MSNARLGPQEREGVRRFIADYRASTRYRVWVKVKGTWEPCAWLPSYSMMAEAELAAAKIAGRTRVDVERGGERVGIEGGAFGNAEAAPVRGLRENSPVADSVRAACPSSDLDSHDTPAPLRCAKCGIFEDDPDRAYGNPKGTCWTFDTPDGYPEPNGEHEWGSF